MKTGIKIRPCNVGAAEQHNSRNPDYCARLEAKYGRTYFFTEYRSLNSSWVNPNYQDCSLPDLLAKEAAEVKAKTGRAPAMKDRERVDRKTGKVKTIAGWSPLREGVAPVKPDTKISDFNPFIEWLNGKGLSVVRIDIHHDEGHETDEGEFKANHHAHIVIDYLDHSTGKTVKLTDEDISEMQAEIAKSLGMERGTAKVITGAEGLGAVEYKLMKQQEREKNLEQKNQELEQKNQEQQQRLDKLEQKNQELKQKNQEQQRRLDKLEQKNQELEQRTGVIAQIESLFNVGPKAEIRTVLQAVREERDGLRKELEQAKADFIEQKEKAVEAAILPYNEQKKKLDMIARFEPDDDTRKAAMALSQTNGYFEWDISTQKWRGTQDMFDYQDNVFDPLCDNLGCHNAADTQSAIKRRLIVAQSILISLIRTSSRKFLERCATSLDAMARHFDLKYWRERQEQTFGIGQNRNQERDREQEQEQHTGWKFHR